MKTNMTRFRLIVMGFITSIFILSMPACKNENKSQTSDNASNGFDISDQKDNVINEISEYTLPTSFEVTKLLIEAGAGYIFDLGNDVENVGQYSNSSSKALNLGVYGADLSYAATYKQTQQTMQYLKASGQLIEELKIAGGFNKSLVERVDANLDNIDSLIIIISDSFYDTYNYLITNEQSDLSILVMAGSWIEAMFISTQISIISIDNKKIIDIIADQNTTLEKLIEVMEPIKESDMGASIYEGLTGLHEIYKGISGEITSEQLMELISKTEGLRNTIIS